MSISMTYVQVYPTSHVKLESFIFDCFKGTYDRNEIYSFSYVTKKLLQWYPSILLYHRVDGNIIVPFASCKLTDNDIQNAKEFAMFAFDKLSVKKTFEIIKYEYQNQDKMKNIMEKTLLSSQKHFNKDIINVILQYCYREPEPECKGEHDPELVSISESEPQCEPVHYRDEHFWTQLSMFVNDRNEFGLSAAQDGLLIFCEYQEDTRGDIFTRVWDISDFSWHSRDLLTHLYNHVFSTKSKSKLKNLELFPSVEYVGGLQNYYLMRGYHKQSVGFFTLAQMGFKKKKNYVKNAQVKYLVRNTKSMGIAMFTTPNLMQQYQKFQSPFANDNWSQQVKDSLEFSLWYDQDFSYFITDSELKNDMKIPHRLIVFPND
jgi:hypothetical protein